MHLRPRHRLRIALVAIFCLLFQQLAVAAYACEPSARAAHASTSSHCEQMSGKAQDSSPLCEKHCAPDQSTAADHVQLSVPAVALGSIEFASLLAAPDAGIALRADVPVSRSDPPPRLRYCSLLI
jgi:hypothetical protein